MTARDNVRKWMIADHKDELLDAFRAEVLREAARLVEDAACDADFTEEPEFIAGLRAAVERLNRAAVSGSTAGDEQPEVERLRAERDGLKTRLSDVLDICDREQRSAMRWQDPIPVPGWVAVVQRAALGDSPKGGAR